MKKTDHYFYISMAGVIANAAMLAMILLDIVDINAWPLIIAEACFLTMFFICLRRYDSTRYYEE